MVLDKDMLISRWIDNMFNIDYIKAIILKFLRTSNKNYMRKKNSTKHEYLLCSGNRDGYDDCINKSSIRYDELANLVLDAINKKIQKFYDENELENLDSKKKENRFNKKIISLEKQRDDINNKISKTRNYLRNFYEDKVNGVVTPEQFKDLITNYNKANVCKQNKKT